MDQNFISILKLSFFYIFLIISIDSCLYTQPTWLRDTVVSFFLSFFLSFIFFSFLPSYLTFVYLLFVGVEIYCCTWSHWNTHTFARTPLDEGSARCRELNLTTHHTHKRQTSMPRAGFELAVPARAWPHAYTLDRTATGIGDLLFAVNVKADCKLVKKRSGISLVISLKL
jgi:hypothetical protein